MAEGTGGVEATVKEDSMRPGNQIGDAVSRIIRMCPFPYEDGAMTAPLSDDADSLSLSAERRVDEVCRRFEAAWKRWGPRRGRRTSWASLPAPNAWPC